MQHICGGLCVSLHCLSMDIIWAGSFASLQKINGFPDLCLLLSFAVDLEECISDSLVLIGSAVLRNVPSIYSFDLPHWYVEYVTILVFNIPRGLLVFSS